jgi:hypothetical protein
MTRESSASPNTFATSDATASASATRANGGTTPPKRPIDCSRAA